MDFSVALARKQQTLMQRARILQAIRAFFITDDFLEVETPQRLPGNAPEMHIDAEPSGPWFLQTSPELCMKRLLAAGCPRLFQISRCWRQGERGRRHLPEFTLLEWYRGGADYHALMEDCRKLLSHLVPGGRLQWQGREIDLSSEWQRLTVDEAFRRYAGCSCLEALEQDRFDQLLVEKVEPCLGLETPTLLCDYPLPLGALARRKPDDPRWAERFELYVAGIELANGFSELCDPVEQVRRFAAEEEARRQAGKPPYPVPTRFLRELGRLESAAGIALGIDRLVMLLTDKEDIAEVVAFPPEDL
ncbi:EF-P lysine aminoacylase GenX [Geothermobacter hydrogeniphilus]|uniref:EF-P lysine aminoacylase GenX n=1 Tax=Geothermobacter hydrogeniphilus TaxID=1969733 RepID=A0A1X0Y3Z0_9BACT|nr:EF-P lysine aminoacylase GenX [Geothermobacter hydrogeniphilus]ORJ59863.1 EF-P lysine aminoacylase GenX [Geothermobacter hydrogeniphilus]